MPLVRAGFDGVYGQANLGNVFHGVTAAAGVVLPTNNSATIVFGLWNPAGSGKNAVLLKFKAGYNSTVGAAGNIQYNALTGAGSAIGTAAPVVGFTTGTPTNGVIGAGNASVMKFTPSSGTLTTAGTIIGTSGFSQDVTTATTATAPMWNLRDEFEGEWIVPPGVLWYPVGSIALLATWDLELVWAEMPF